MDKGKIFDSEIFNDFSYSDIEEAQTKEQTHRNYKEDDELNKLPNIDLIKIISQTLDKILGENKKNLNYKKILKKQSKMVFSSNTVPSISIEDYLIRIQRYANMEKNTLIVSLIFIDRLCKINSLTLTYNNIHRILFTAILLSIKYNEDSFYDNKYYAQIAGVKLQELKSLEYNFINMINFQFFVKDEIFEKYRIYLNNLE